MLFSLKFYYMLIFMAFDPLSLTIEHSYAKFASEAVGGVMS